MSLVQISRTLTLALSTLGGATLLAGCVSTTPALDATFGDAVRQARAAQTLNPNASANRDPVMGVDGKAGSAAQDRYHESFRTPPKTFEVINIGGALSGN